MASVELFRFRTVRPVQSKNNSFTALPILSSAAPAPNNRRQARRLQPEAAAAAPQVPDLGTYRWLQQISEQLAAASDELSPTDLISLLPTDWKAQISSNAWAALKQQLADSLGAFATQVRTLPAPPDSYGIVIVPTSLTQPIELLCRRLLVHDMLGVLAADVPRPVPQRQLQTADDVRKMLTFRAVALPPALFRNTPPVIARAPGVTDLSVVKDEWNRYIPDQIANVVNVLPGETFDSGSRHLEKTEQSQSTATAQSTIQTTENSQTQSSTLASTASKDASINVGVNGQVETSGQYGPVQVSTSLGAQAQFSQSSSESTSRTTAVETVARAVKTVAEGITQVQTSRTTIRDTSHEQHKLQNTGTNVVVGLYRWLSIVHRAQLISFPNRFVVEFEIPEPGAWLRWALQNQPDKPWDHPDPGAFAVNSHDPRLDPADPATPDPNATPLQPTDLSPDIVASLAARWRVQGIAQAPPATIVLSAAYSLSPQGGSNATNAVYSDNTLAVPDGYYADTWNFTAALTAKPSNSNATFFNVNVGGSAVTIAINGDGDTHFYSWDQAGATDWTQNPTTQSQRNNVSNDNILAVSIPLGAVSTGTIPVSANAVSLADGAGVTFNITIRCRQLPVDPNDPQGPGRPYLDWQIATFNALAAAYNDLLTAHDQERAQRAQTDTGPMIVGPPQLNLARAVAELKRLAIQNLLGQTFRGYDLLTLDAGTQEPSLDPPQTLASSPAIQFFEQAFEWSNIVYICYPYFWGAKSRWVLNATSASADAVFDQFLNAGSVRLVVPAKPGFENAVNFFLYTSCIWSGKAPPGPNDPGYLSVADEIQAVQIGATDGTPVGDPWEVTLPTTLLWAGTDPSQLPVNANATIGPPPLSASDTSVRAAVTIALTSPAVTAVYGQALTFAATVTGPAGAAVSSGQITFLIDGQTTADSPVPLGANGQARSAPVTSLAVGSHTVTATYGGSTTFAAGSGTFAQTVAPAATSTTVQSSRNPSPRNQRVRFTATVQPVAPGGGGPAGQVTFLVDGAPTADSPVALGRNDAAVSARISLTRGDHNVTANYLGNQNFAPSSASLTQTMN